MRTPDFVLESTSQTKPNLQPPGLGFCTSIHRECQREGVVAKCSPNSCSQSLTDVCLHLLMQVRHRVPKVVKAKFSPVPMHYNMAFPLCSIPTPILQPCGVLEKKQASIEGMRAVCSSVTHPQSVMSSTQGVVSLSYSPGAGCRNPFKPIPR